ncbi:ribonuclease R [Inhella gelatinilytica]|uniref:Ribonuclease R n=1 Tax=Inhella gelatinilytica TaxID=2795030 RepID=A0A931IV83_9BURK|nr:ribonuclease R [Inhella gelatinilytica]MBH9553405.1 ribonuclease R [Inhella gelatinilytica]
MQELTGTLQGHRDGHGFVLLDGKGPDLYIPANEMRAALHGDVVRARVVRIDKRGRPEGRILEIVERRKRPLIGRLLIEQGVWLVAPEDKRLGQDILIPKPDTAQARPGQVVAVELTEVPTLYAQPVGRITEVLGDIDDPGLEIEIAVRKYEVPYVFSPETLAQSAKLPEKLRAADLKGRVDLRDVNLVTIDGEDARDFDDAVYCEPHGKAGWRLLVAIADVSHYVKPGEALDDDAFDRATSVYFPRRVIPMLPEKLSNGLCSLNPEVERLCMVCDMTVSSEGQVKAFQFYPAVMVSQARFTYTEVAAILGNTHGPEAQRRRDLVPALLNLHGVYQALLQARARRGAVDFDTPETQIICDENGRIERIVPRVRNEAHRLIEECMLAANVCAAEFIQQAEHPSLFRVHEGPTEEKRQTLMASLRALGLTPNLPDPLKPADLQALAESTKNRPDTPQVHMLLLRSMQQAMYTPYNNGHFGLAYSAYTHFTSPIRRYPDLLVHRVIKALLQGKRYALTGHGRGKQAQAEAVQAWEQLGLHCSANERRADEASRDVEAWLKCRYMRDRLGEDFLGHVTSVAPFGLFVQLESLFVEGLVHITELGGEYFRFDEARQELRGERTGIRFGLGARLHVQVSRVDLDGRRIEFRLFDPKGADTKTIGFGKGVSKTGGKAGGPAVQRLKEVEAESRQFKRARQSALRESQPAGRKTKNGRR